MIDRSQSRQMAADLKNRWHALRARFFEGKTVTLEELKGSGRFDEAPRKSAARKPRDDAPADETIEPQTRPGDPPASPR